MFQWFCRNSFKEKKMSEKIVKKKHLIRNRQFHDCTSKNKLFTGKNTDHSINCILLPLKEASVTAPIMLEV